MNEICMFTLEIIHWKYFLTSAHIRIKYNIIVKLTLYRLRSGLLVPLLSGSVLLQPAKE